ncbi:hypothetical protein BpHYR1_024827 [Brachionus plicatilis]|uniref:Uncharacterized protein n=1 Tax=Brachionus plicatilis TaxID=10195 RepID=A0A3M7PPQ5_BRAPC|nr:hypothetical protein BpHYR1_024827 [Brachionus plicatilis]
MRNLTKIIKVRPLKNFNQWVFIKKNLTRKTNSNLNEKLITSLSEKHFMLRIIFTIEQKSNA